MCCKLINANSHHNITPTRHQTRVARQKCWLSWVLSCQATLFECLQHDHLSVRQVPLMWRHKPDLLLFKTVTGTGNLSKENCNKLTGDEVFSSLKENCNEKLSFHMKESSKCWRTICISLELYVVLELLSFEVESRNHQRGMSLFQKF